MKTRKQVKQELDELSSQYAVDMSQISSFTTCVHDLPSNEQIKRDFPDLSKVKPLTLGPHGNTKKDAFKPSKNTHYTKTDVAFPFPFKEPNVYNPDRNLKTEKFPNFFDSDDLINDEFMFVSLNCAKRETDGVNPQEHDWQMFHDTSKHYDKTYRLYLEINQKRFKDCYITDALKNTIETNSKKIQKQFILKSKSWFQLKPEDALKAKNKETYILSLKMFISECTIIQPKHLIVFGNYASDVLKMMKKDIENQQKELATAPQILSYVSQLIDNRVVFDHYSTQKILSVQEFINKSEHELWPRVDKSKPIEFPNQFHK